MAIINSFLCWSNTRTGSAVCGYYSLVISVVCLAFYMMRYIALDGMKDSIELKGIVYAGFVLYSFFIGVSLILLPGVYMDRKFLLLPWIYVLVITVLYETGAIALITTVHLEKEHTLSPWEIVAIVFYCIRLVANCYCFACVVSQYQELSEGRGTYDFLFKPRRRNMVREIPISDFDEYHTPYGATLPPYSEIDLYKEFSPPTYESLAREEEERRWMESRCQAYRLRGAASASCLAEVIVNTPPPDFDDIELYDDNCYQHRSQQYQHQVDRHLHHHERHNEHHPHQHHHRQRHHHHRHHSLPHPHQDEFNFDGDISNANVELIHHARHRSDGSQPTNDNNNYLEQRLRGSSSCQLQIHRSYSQGMTSDSADISCPPSPELTLPKEPITMTESSGSFLSFNQTDFRTPTPKSSPASVHSCQRMDRSPPVIQKRTYITWI